MRLGLTREWIGRLGSALAWIALIVLVAVAVNLVGIRLVGNVDGWAGWVNEHAGCFLVWRLGLYGITAYGWMRMRRRLRASDASLETHRRLRRAEIGALAAIALLEISVFWRQP